MGVTREQLFEEVWAEPMVAVAKRYNVTSTFLAQVCQRLKVPRPPRGYWNQIAHGHKPPRSSLSPALPGDQVEWLRDGERWVLPRPLEKPVEPVEQLAPTARPKHRPKEHPIVAGTHPLFEVSHREDEGYLRPKKQLLPDLLTSRETLPRALKTASEFFLALEDRGYHVVIAPYGVHYHRPVIQYFAAKQLDRYSREPWIPGRPTILHVGTVAYGLSVYEISEPSLIAFKDGEWKRVGPAPTTPLKPSIGDWRAPYVKNEPGGRLGIRAYAPYRGVEWVRDWRETKRGDLKARFGEIAETLEREVPTILRLIEEDRLEQEELRRKLEAERIVWERKQDEERRAKALKESKEELLSMMQAWSYARHLQEFFDLATREVERLDGEERVRLLEKLERAKKVFGAPNPLDRLRAWRLPEER